MKKIKTKAAPKKKTKKEKRNKKKLQNKQKKNRSAYILLSPCAELRCCLLELGPGRI
jgi:hypothetical protein